MLIKLTVKETNFHVMTLFYFCFSFGINKPTETRKKYILQLCNCYKTIQEWQCDPFPYIYFPSFLFLSSFIPALCAYKKDKEKQNEEIELKTLLILTNNTSNVL